MGWSRNANVLIVSITFHRVLLWPEFVQASPAIHTGCNPAKGLFTEFSTRRQIHKEFCD